MNIMRTDRLIELIKNSGLTKLQIAEESGISRTTLDNIIAGADLKISTLERIVNVLGAKMSYLFEDDSQSDDTKVQEYQKEIERLSSLLNNGRASAKVVVELDVTNDEFVRLGLNDKLVQVLSKK